MAILAECPVCKRKWSAKKKACKCGENLDQAKRSQRVKYWINYRLPNGKQRREYVGSFEGLNGYSIEDARVAESKRKTQKRENRLLDITDDSKMTFNELTEWYLDLERVKNLASFNTITININKFNAVFGDKIISHIKPVDLENYQAKRLKEGISAGTVDHEIGKTKTMIYKAFDNDKVSGRTLRTFKKIKKALVKGSDIRDRILTINEFNGLMKHSEKHLKPIIAMGYYTGMRKGEILKLTWGKVDLANRMIRLEITDTKDKEARNIPICDELYKIIVSLPNRIQKTNEDNHVFQYKGAKIKGDFRNSLKKACKKAGIIYGRFEKNGFIFHDLRHTFNTNMRKSGVAESVIMDITGHSSRSMFDRYNTVDEDDTRKAIEQLQTFLKSVDQGEGQSANVDQTVDQNGNSNKNKIG
jgi:integrase